MRRATVKMRTAKWTGSNSAKSASDEELRFPASKLLGHSANEKPVRVLSLLICACSCSQKKKEERSTAASTATRECVWSPNYMAKRGVNRNHKGERVGGMERAGRGGYRMGWWFGNWKEMPKMHIPKMNKLGRQGRHFWTCWYPVFAHDSILSELHIF